MRYHYSLSVILTILLTFSMVTSTLAIPRTEKDLQYIANNLTETPVKYGDIPSITQPEYISVNDANLTLEGRDPVFIVFIPGSQPRIYPQRIMVWHEVVNEYINGKSYVITYSPISGSMAAYESTIEGMNLIFDTEGKLFNSTSVLIDRNTGSLWSQLIGMAFDGPLKGKGLRYIVSWWTTWDKAKEMYPTALVLATPRGTNKPYGRDPYGSYVTHGNYYDDERIVYPVVQQDKKHQLHPKTKVLGIEIEGLPLAIDEAYVKEKKVVNFYFGPYALVALYDSRLDIVRVFNREVWDKQILFTQNPQGLLVDIDTNTIWNYDGIAIQGKLKDASISEFFGINAFWFSWYAFNPESLLVPGSTVVPSSALIKNALFLE
ncbi:DUF3179 domain-containing protein [Lawsonia intracellularis]|uniref:DUF3179 domain-containing protein n=1 Tax=Lawsonia intracellularis (strain PHE/MN1-00) TaxID=363253 RepID=Q1MRR6_LAWIP|nr:DUF3179 domain-containing protein [Lawsonia intracellularis]AGC49663.1 hypothetical protein LAW_00262 [Lawsonia intracellularis N343]KAA0205168.1 DUF3179 domain-containing protein [Lawsonia intracellularis]MBZ3892303.1 DUF3179 domain-containing protein [Lawsonia intracellularis]OMQ05884.1 hypothetical protein BW722_01365 [Lawsonia intracellularis]RBN32285.1 DUF3179 domain-containing protein [Lawsonia intracellularis]